MNTIFRISSTLGRNTYRRKTLRGIQLYSSSKKYLYNISDEDSNDYISNNHLNIYENSIFPTAINYTKLQKQQQKYEQQQKYQQQLEQLQQLQLQKNKCKTKNLLVARNPNQQHYIDILNTMCPSIVVATGPAGSAKSYIAVSVGIDKLVNKEYKRIVITRPAVSVDEEMGFFPGSINEKMDPWMRPLYDTFYKYYSVAEVKTMISNKIIDICPIAYLRGRTLEDSYIIIDEAQNCTINQMLMILTRIGSGSKMVITGDLSQHDRGFEINGLGDFVERLNNNGINKFNCISDICHIQFTEDDIERHPVIKDIMKLYK